MFEFKGFTQKANRALNLAVEAAQNMGHRYVGTEHVLYGLAAEGSGVAAAALEQCGISAQSIQSKIAATSGTGAQTRLSADAFTPRTKRVLQTAAYISAKMGQSYVGTEHLLLALISDGDSYADEDVQAIIDEMYERVERDFK